MSETQGTGPRLRRASMAPNVFGDEHVDHVGTLPDGYGQAQIKDPEFTWMLHIKGTPEAWRHLAKVIEDAAMELERQLADEEREKVAAHYGAMADQAEAEKVEV